MPVIAYKSVTDFPGWIETGRDTYVTNLLQRYRCQQVFEVGGGANPALDPDYVRSNGIMYLLNDARPEELAKADGGFQQVVFDLSGPAVPRAMLGSFDCVFSLMVGEHVADGRRFHQNVQRILRPGGIAFHCFSTLWAAPFALNLLLPEALSNQLYRAVGARDAHRNGKFPARYSWCRGPSRKMVNRYERLGFEVVEYAGYFGHNYYHRVPWLHRAERLKARLLLKRPSAHLCSYASVLLRKPGTTEIPVT